jgi:Nif-specific regulatory protein
MATMASGYLVLRREDGFGEVFALTPGPRYRLGRAVTNRIVLKDDLCSREHAELYEREHHWHLRDLGSLNGTRVNGRTVTTDVRLNEQDEVNLGRTTFVFVTAMNQLPDAPASNDPVTHDELAIKKRLSQTSYLVKVLPNAATAPPPTRAVRDTALLYRLAIEMGAAGTPDELISTVLDGLLDATEADVGAVLAIKDGADPELLAYRHRDPQVKTYYKVSRYVTTEVLAACEGVLAENVAQDQHLRNRESLSELHVLSLICAPVLFEGTVLGLIHLYSTKIEHRLNSDDLEFALAVARQFGIAYHQMRRQTALATQNQTLRSQLNLESELVGASSALSDIEEMITRVAETNATVLVRGESGVGKELVARAIHTYSPRRDGPLICLNCAALTETLLESELFGHEKGAFTGATERKLGKFEAADHGTLFLDEIGEMQLSTQAKLLRALEGHAFERVGGHQSVRVDVRVVAATNRALEEAVKAGTFRRDLFYRLQVVEIRVPPLRERKADVPVLAEHFLQRFVRETGRKIRGFTPAALLKLQAHNWPGNVRELRNAIERAVALSLGPQLDAADIWLSALDLHDVPLLAPEPPALTYQPQSLEMVEREHIQATLNHTDWNKSQAAKILGIERSTLDRKINTYELKR